MLKILIIGGGVSGLSAGVYAQMNGYHAIVCEKQKIAGGNLTGWKRGEYHIDNCIHWLTGTNPHTETYKIWTDLGALGSVDVYQADTLYTCEHKGKRLSLDKDLKKLERDMIEISPQDYKETKALIKAVETMQAITGIAGENHDQKCGFIAKARGVSTLAKYYKWTTGDLANRFTHPLLRKFITSLMGDLFSALALLVVFSTFCGENGGIPEGSSQAMAQRIAERFTALGGELLLNKEAVKVNVKNGKANSVTFADGTRLRADYVVLTGDPAATFGKILPTEMPKPLEKLYKKQDMPRFSSYHCAYSCSAAQLPFRGDFIFELSKKDQILLGTENLVVREFSHEKGFAPKGKNVLQTLTFCDEETSKEFIKLREDKQAYKARKKQISDAIERIITKKFPKLKGKLECIDVWTPATYQRYTNAEVGSFMSFLLPPKVLPKPLDNRVENLKNVILATQWLQAPGGLPIAAKVGKRAIETIKKQESRKKI